MKVKEIISDYKKLYHGLFPDEDAVNVAKDLWVEWEKSGVPPPDIDKIVDEHQEYEIGFFYDIVKIAERLENKNFNINYCAVCLDKYNFYAISASDGYVVLVDDKFFQFLFMFILILIFHAQGEVEDQEEEAAITLIKEMFINNYFNRKQFDFSKDKVIPGLLKKDYELAEFANYFFHSLKIFIISHEIGHHVLNHTSGMTKKKFGMRDENLSIQVDERKKLDEFEADDYAYQLFLEVNQTVDESIKYAYCKYKFDFAPLFLFDLFEKFDKLSEKWKNEAIIYNTHPEPINRKEAISTTFTIDVQDPLYSGLKKSLDMITSTLLQDI